MSELRTYHGNTPPYNILSDASMQKILETIYQLMREVGIKFDSDPRVLDLLSSEGCDISRDGIVRFPTDLVKSSLNTAGKSARVWNRSCTDFMEISNLHSVFWAGLTCVNIIDFKTGERRPSTKDDLAAITRVADALPDIDGVCLPCKMTDRPDVYGEIEEFAVMAANTTKPLKHLCQYVEPLQAAIEMAAAIRGGLENLKEKPYFVFTISPMPLYFVKHNIDQIFLTVENGIPANFGGMTVGGASAPITHAGNLVNMMATDFAGIVLMQLIKKGSFCMIGSVPAFIDPLTGSLSGMGEMGLTELARSQISRFFGLPMSSGAGTSFSPQFNQHAVFDLTASMWHTVFCRAADYVSVGSIEGMLTYSPHALIFCNEMAGLVRHVLKGMKVDDESLALHVTKSVGIGGDFLSEMHTAIHCRSDLWNPRYLRSMTADQWEQGGKKDVVDRIDGDLQRILATHHPEPLPEPIQRRIGAILAQFGVAEK